MSRGMRNLSVSSGNSVNMESGRSDEVQDVAELSRFIAEIFQGDVEETALKEQSNVKKEPTQDENPSAVPWAQEFLRTFDRVGDRLEICRGN